MSLKEASNGWFNYLRSKMPNIDTGKIEKIANEREKICSECESLNYSRIFSRYACNECGCALPAILFSQGKKCPLDKW